MSAPSKTTLAGCPPMTAERARAILETRGVYRTMADAAERELAGPGVVVDAPGRRWEVACGWADGELRRLHPETGDPQRPSDCASYLADAALAAAARFLAFGR